ncbi:ABC transporter substrate-binding protein [Paracoccus sp. MBLB3053]|uniref:ABC transporter substrate-binding protein n=1 Tax=Paracoccus aurantius TaxID=3073814 RepID=A0ABU2HXR6_9RHOB|nr:ABC transporter substrate-binding protein [Paracoccus sp. MBLB3053]MDS9469831.1 ABC transporter substrate-binding protein [Paracoccus sp. MBLB3053]
MSDCGKNLSTRRDILRAGAGVGTAMLGTVALPSLLRAQEAPIVIGHLVPLTGFLGTLGQYAINGFKLGVDQINASGGINGRQITVIAEDSINPETAATKAQRMIERDKVDVLVGEISSASALAISEVAARNKKLFIATGPRSDVLRADRCSRYMFCTDIPNAVMVNAVGTALKQDGMVEGKKFFTITSDYVFGHDLLKAAKAFFADNKADLVGEELVPTDATDFSANILKIRQANPDIVCLNLGGNQVTNFLKQYAEFGLAYPTVGFNLNTADAWAAGMGSFGGVWPTVWFDTIDTEGTKKFVADYKAAFNDQIPENHAWIEYITAKILEQSIKEVGGTDNEKLIDYLESEAKFDILKHRPAYFRKFDHQLVQEAYSFSVKDEGSYNSVYDMLQLGAAVPPDGEDLTTIYPADSGACKL